MTNAEDAHASTDSAQDDATMGAVCWLAAVCTECGALIEGGTCWNCGARRVEE